MTALEETMASRAQRSVLVVEADSYLRALVAGHLVEAGYLVHTAASAADARLQITSVDPDAVVIDVDLGPGPSGLDIARSLKAQADEIGLVCLTRALDPRFVGRDAPTARSRTAYVQKHLLGDSVALLVAVNSVVLKRHVVSDRLRVYLGQEEEPLSTPQLRALQSRGESAPRRPSANDRHGAKSFWSFLKK